MQTDMSEIDALLHENRKFPPPDAFRAQRARRPTRRSTNGRRQTPRPSGKSRRTSSSGSRSGTTVLDWKPPHAKWFVGGKLNVSVNCVDRHIKTARRNKAALIWEGEPGDRRTLTYWDLYVEVQKFANVLKKLGVKRGDRVAIYMPLIPEVAIAMLACTRIGAMHSVVFGGFSPESLQRSHQRREVQGAHHRGRRLSARRRSSRSSETPTRRIEECPTIEHVVVVQRRPGAARRRSVRRHEGRARPLVASPHARRATRLRAREDGRRGRALHPLHVGHDGKAEGHRSHDGRLSHRRRRDDEARLRPQGRRRLLVHRRRRLGDGPLVSRLRSARQRRDVRDVRGRARLAGEGSLLGASASATA